jgi:cephalosporin-C deacetylase-like acetyl esterase
MAATTSIRREKFQYQSLGETAVGDLLLPAEGNGPFPTVITGSGFAGVKEILLPFFAERLAAAGIACLAIDFIGFGESSGALRQDIKPFDQIQTLKDGLTALEKDERIDRNRLGAWGPSLGGAHTLVLAAEEKRLRAAVAIIPHISVQTSFKEQARMFIPSTLDLIRRVLGKPSATIAISGKPGDKAVMTTDGAQEWFEEVAANAPLYKNEVTIASLLRMVKYNTAPYAARIRIPILAVTAKDDGITPATKIHNALKGVKTVTFKDYPGTHFGLFGEYKEEVIALTVEFFQQHLTERPAQASL